MADVIKALDSPTYLAFVRRQPCYGCNAPPPNHAHHWPMRSRGAVDDSRTIPLCARCHQCAHGITVVKDGERFEPPSDDQQRAAVDAIFRRFIETAAPEEVRSYARDRARSQDGTQSIAF